MRMCKGLEVSLYFPSVLTNPSLKIWSLPLPLLEENVKWCSCYEKLSGKIKNRVTVWTTISYLGIYLKKMKSGSRWDTCSPIFIVALFTIPKRWKQPNHPWVVEWIKTTWYIHTMEYYAALKKGSAPICDNMDGPVGHYA